MADRWMDDRDRQWRERDWRRSERYGRRGDEQRDYERRSREARSWDDENRYGEDYGQRNQRPGGGAYGAGGDYGGGEGYGRSERYGRGRGYGDPRRQDYGRRPEWQERDYGGVSPAMRQGEYELGEGGYRGYGSEANALRVQSQDYTGRSGEDRREDYSQYGRRDYAAAERGRYTEDRFENMAREADWPPEDLGYDPDIRGAGGSRSPAGGQLRERGYGDWGRGYLGEGARPEGSDRGGHRPGDFLHRAGERLASWFGGGEHRDDDRREDERREDDRRHQARGFRGMGPKGYQRPDERINEEAHERLTEDSWVDASNITLSVSGGEVTLSGTVDSREAKHRAERIVEDISGVSHVQNNLRIARGNFFTTPTSGYGDSVVEAQMRAGDPSAESSTTKKS